METYFILLNNNNAEKKEESKKINILVNSGSLWTLVDDQNNFTEFLNLRSCELIDVTMKCLVSDIMRINDTELQLLLPIEIFKERLRIIKETNLLQYGCELFEIFQNGGHSKTEEPMINIRCIRGTLECVQGFIKYVGSIPGRSGLWFGIELIKCFEGLGTTDGSICGKRFFECNPNCALFVSLDKLSIISMEDDLDLMYASIDEARSCFSNGHSALTYKENNFAASNSDSSYTSTDSIILNPKLKCKQLNHAEDINSNATMITDQNEIFITEITSPSKSDKLFNGHKTHIQKSTSSDVREYSIPSVQDNITENKLEDDVPLALNERIVWVSDFGPELGFVKWIGVLPSSTNNEVTVGVEFDRPIGTGTGKYNGEQLFRTPPKHASLIPILGLMRAQEFFGAQYKYEPSNLNGNAMTFNGLELGHEKRLIRSECCTPSSEDGTPKKQKFRLSRPPPPPGKTPLPEKSIYDEESDPCYENMEKEVKQKKELHSSGKSISDKKSDEIILNKEKSKSLERREKVSDVTNKGKVAGKVKSVQRSNSSCERKSTSRDIIERVKKSFTLGTPRESETLKITNKLINPQEIKPLPVDREKKISGSIPYRTGRSVFYERVNDENVSDMTSIRRDGRRDEDLSSVMSVFSRSTNVDSIDAGHNLVRHIPSTESQYENVVSSKKKKVPTATLR